MPHPKIRTFVRPQYNACLAITGAIRGTSKEKLYDKLGLKSLQLRRWVRKLGYFYKFYKNESSQCIFNLFHLRYSSSTTRNAENKPLFKTKPIFSKIHFFSQLLSSGTVLIITFEKSEPLVFLKTIS